MPKHPFDYHRPSAEQVERITAIREACKACYDVLLASAPGSAERTLAIRKLEEVSMWANKAIVLEEGTPVDESQSPVIVDIPVKMEQLPDGTYVGLVKPPTYIGPPVDNDHVAPGCEKFSQETIDGICDLPPAGWYCTRGKGHDGPCAAHPMVDGNMAPEEANRLQPLGALNPPGSPPTYIGPPDFHGFPYRDKDGNVAS